MRRFRVGLSHGLCAGLGQGWLSIKDGGFWSFLIIRFSSPLVILNMSFSYQEVPIASIGPLTAPDCESPPPSSVVGGFFGTDLG